MPITRLRFTNVGPFDDVDFEFDSQVNVFTGPNNSGKSTALWVLGEIVVYPFIVPTKLLRGKEATWRVDFQFGQETRGFSGSIPVSQSKLTELEQTYEQIGYTTFVPALRYSTDFRSGGPSVLPDLDRGIEETLELLSQTAPALVRKSGLEEIRQGLRIARTSDSPDLRKRSALFSSQPFLASDKAVIQKILDLDYKAYRRNDPAIRDIVERIAPIASEITEGFPIQFLGVAEDENGLFPQFRTPDGDIPINVLSQGTQSIIQWLAHLLIGYAEYYDYPPDLEERPGILIIDEIDASLHPSWQRRIIPTLISHFPNLQIFCSTHSPLMLAGLKQGQVQLLRRDGQGKVTVSRNETDIIGWSADEILRNLLDVPSPTDLETVKQVDRLQELRRKDSLTTEEAEELERLRHRVSQDLLGGPMAAELDRLAELLKDARAHVSTRSEPGPSTEARSTRTRRKPSDSCTG
jgi:hypothetical protein